MRVVGVIPSRYDSTRLPGKPLADICGKPMIQYVYERATGSKLLGNVIVATDDERIVEAVQGFGGEAALTSPDHPNGTSRVAEVARNMDTDIVINIQGDEPLIDPQLVDAVATLLAARPEAGMSTAAHAIDSVADFTSPNVVKVVLDAMGMAMYFSRAPIPWWRDGFAAGITSLPQPAPLRHVGLYAYRVGFLRRFPLLPQAPLEREESLEQLRALWHGVRIAVHVSDHAPGAGVDTPEDLARVRRHFSG